MKLRGQHPRLAVIFIVLSTVYPLKGEEVHATSPQTAPSGSEPDWGNGARECASCGSTGRIACPTCDGQGSLRKPCPTCQGKGRKPCPQCAVADGSTRTPTPGKIPCTACGGKGATEGASDRACFRCKGALTLPCPLCFGRGSMSCPKTRYDKVCPTCGFVGKVPCPDCQGGKAGEAGRPGEKRTALKQGAKADDLPVDVEAEDGDSSVEEKPSVGSVRKEKVYSEESYRADHKAASAVWEELKKECEESRKLFKGESPSEIRKIRGDLSILTRSLADGSVSDGPEFNQLKQRVKDARGQIEGLDRSWGNLEDHYDRVAKVEERLRAKWDELPEWTPKFQPPQREAIREHFERLSSLLSVGRKYSSTLRGENPERIATGIKEVLATTEELRRDVDKAKAASASLAKAQAKQVAAARQAKEKELARAEDVRRRQETSRREAREELDPDQSSAKPAGGASLVPAKGAKPTRAIADDGDHGKKPSDSSPSARSGEGSASPAENDRLAVTLGMLGVALCGAVYYILHRRDGRATPIPKKVNGRKAG